MDALISVDPEAPPVPLTPAARGDEEWVVNARLAYIDNLLAQARDLLVASSDVRWASSAADAYAAQLTGLNMTVEAVQTAADDTRVKFATLTQAVAYAAQMQVLMSAQVGYQPVTQGWHG